eukprot:524886_1
MGRKAAIPAYPGLISKILKYRNRNIWGHFARKWWCSHNDLPENNELTPKYLMELFEKQGGKCAISGMDMNISSQCDWSCRLYRVNKDIGYKKTNCMLICTEFQGRTESSNNSRVMWKDVITKIPLLMNQPSVVDINPSITSKVSDLHEAMQKQTDRTICAICDKRLSVPGALWLCADCKQKLGIEHVIWTNLKDRLRTAKKGSVAREKKNKSRGIYDLTFESALDTLSKQQYRGYYSKIPLVFEKNSPFTISIERTDNMKGYTIEDTRFEGKIFNALDHSFAYTTQDGIKENGSPQWTRMKCQYFCKRRFNLDIRYTDEFC